jgi:hypothetical protein
MSLLNFNFGQKSGKNGKQTTSQLILKLPEIKILSMIGRNEREHFEFLFLLKACPTGFFHGKTASPKFQFSSPGRQT